MAKFETKYNVGDVVYFYDRNTTEVVGPEKITEILVSAVGEKTGVRYYFAKATSRRERDVFPDRDSALSASRNQDRKVAQPLES